MRLQDYILAMLVTIYVTVKIFNYFRKKTKGCLYGKTNAQKMDFFKSLHGFIEKDIIFYNHQYHDLLPDEKEEFEMWILENHYLN